MNVDDPLVTALGRKRSLSASGRAVVLTDYPTITVGPWVIWTGLAEPAALPGVFMATHIAKRLIVTLATVCVLMAARSAWACSCASRDISPCREAEMHTLVFVGTVVGEEAGAPSGSGAPRRRLQLSVQEVLFGSPRRSVLVETEASGASCGYPFEKGKQYLVYAAGSDERYGTSVCSRTAPLAAAQNDVALLRERRDGRLRSRVFGTVSGVRPPTPDRTSVDLKFIGIPKIRVTAVGPSARKSTVTDGEGRFVFLGLPAAVYRVRASGPPSDPRTQTKTVTLDRCGAGAYFLFNLSPE